LCVGANDGDVDEILVEVGGTDIAIVGIALGAAVGFWP
jgi:hypothetical protein